MAPAVPLPTLAEVPPEAIPPWLIGAMAVAACASVAAIAIATACRRQGLAVLPLQPRRPVPWGAWPLVVIMLVYLATTAAAVDLVTALLPPELNRPPAAWDIEKAAAHPAVMLLVDADLRVLWVCGLATVLVAPIVEEFFFRVLLQGWLEAANARLRPQMPVLSRLLPGATGPIVLASLVFAAPHFRVARPTMRPAFLTLMLAADSAAKLLTMAFAILLLRFGLKATAADLGWQREKFLADAKLGLLAFVALAAPIYGMMLGLTQLLPAYLAPDPLVLFPFAFALGIVYYRTHRIVASIVLHMSLNATSVALALLTAKR